ncbi:MAG: M15 family metallopeptidase [Lachnospiraceae bacterium]|nr:M15 family metallopeptidase [Lachnospiraceae bacterium]
MEKICRTAGEQQEIQRRILESIQIKERGGRNRTEEKKKNNSEKQMGQTRKKNSVETGEANECSRRQRQIRNQCMVLGIAAVLMVGAGIVKEAGDRQALQSASGETIQLEKHTGNNGTSVKDEADTILMLVNKDYAVPEDYTVELHWLENGRTAVSELMYDALRDMLTDGSEEGCEFVVASGYRDAALQQELLEEDVQASMEKYGLTREEAYEREARETMPAGHSEHETGLAVDLVALDYQILDGAQEFTKENQWLRAHCHEYGFILRYPAGKEGVTGISYEPWHFRYVGKEAAEEIMESGITLEEYQKAKFPENG